MLGLNVPAMHPYLVSPVWSGCVRTLEIEHNHTTKGLPPRGASPLWCPGCSMTLPASSGQASFKVVITPYRNVTEPISAFYNEVHLESAIRELPLFGHPAAPKRSPFRQPV